MNKKIIALMSAVLISCTGVLTGCGGHKDKGYSKADKVMNEFVDYINTGNYDKAEEWLSFNNAPNRGYFSDFCQTHLQNVTYSVEDKAGDGSYLVTLKSDTDTFKVTLNTGENSNIIRADDFVSEYKIQFASIIDHSSNPDYMNNGQYIGNGITEYTNYTYKADSIKMALETDLGSSTIPDISTSILLDSNGVPESVEYCNDYYDGSNISGHVTVSDGIIKVNKYKVEYYYENFISLFEEVFDSIVECSVNKMSFSEFVNYRHKSLVEACITDNPTGLEEFYNQMLQSAKTNNTGYSYRYETSTCNYNLYTLGEDYIMSFNGELFAYNNRGEQVASSGASTFYVKFELDNKKFEVADIGNNLSEVQEVKEPEPEPETAEPTTETVTKVDEEELSGLQDWQQAYILEIENYKNKWAASNGAKDSDFSFSLLYIDDNDMPELFMCFETYAVGQLLSFRNGEVVYIDNDMAIKNRWLTMYKEKSGKYITRSSGSVWETRFDLYEISNGTRILVNSLSTDVKNSGSFDINDSMYYYFDDTEISKNEWEEKFQQYENEFNSEITSCTYDEIIEQIKNTKVSDLSGVNKSTDSDVLNWKQTYEKVISDIDANSGKSVTKVKAGGGLNMRKKADKNAEKITLIPNHAIVEVTEEGDSWSKVKYKDYTGWVNNSYLTEVSAPSSEDYRYSLLKFDSETAPLLMIFNDNSVYEGMIYRYNNGKAELILDILPGEKVKQYNKGSNLFVIEGDVEIDDNPASEIASKGYFKYYTYNNGKLSLSDEVTRTSIKQAGTDDYLEGTDFHNQDTWEYLENKYGSTSGLILYTVDDILINIKNDYWA